MDYSKPIRLGLFVRIKPIDLFSSQFTFGHRLWMGKAAQEAKSDFELLRMIFDGLHEFEIKPCHVRKVYDYFDDMLKRLQRWCEYEKQLNYEPTIEEKRAGIEIIGKKLKEFATIDAIATRMRISHDQALQLPYDTVFKMLLKDMEQSRFERKLNKIYFDKRK